MPSNRKFFESFTGTCPSAQTDLARRSAFRLLATAGSVLGLCAGLAQAQEPSYSTFTSFTPLQSINGQGGWIATNANWDEEIVNLSGNKVWRVSNSFVTGSFQDQPIAPGTNLYAGESGSNHDLDNAGPVTNRFYASFDFWSVTGGPQSGLNLTISPDCGTGKRQSFVNITDSGTGLKIGFFDTQDNHPATNPNGGFEFTQVALGLSYGDVHSIAFDITFVDGNMIDGGGFVNGNDIVDVYVDGSLVHTGTTWESYYWTTTEGQTAPTKQAIDTLLFRLSTGGGPVGDGLYIDNVFLSDGPPDCLVTPDAIYGGGNDNGSYTIDRQGSVELGLRGKLRYPASNIFNSNGDGTYTFQTGTGGGPAGNSEWSFEWSVNTDYDGMSGNNLDQYTYEIGMDNDPGPGTDYLIFDPITPGEFLPYTVPAGPTVFWDHSMGDNSTPNGGGVEAADGPTYANNLAIYNVAQQSWKPIFYQNTAPYSWNPNVTGRYEYYLAAFDSGGSEVARTAISIVVVDGLTLALEASDCQDDFDIGTPGLQVAMELWLRNPDDVDVTGYQAFLEFDTMDLMYEGSLSAYSSSPFPAHFQPTAIAETATGELRLDGSILGGAPNPVSGDALLATLVFTAMDECDLVSVQFDSTPPASFQSELSFGGSPQITLLADSPMILADDTDPMLVGTPVSFNHPADAGSCTQGTVFFNAPTATDNCDLTPTVVCTPPSGSIFPVGMTTVTCTATDDCGNQSTSTFVVNVTPTNAIDVVVQLTGSMPTTRCIHFMADCMSSTDVQLSFVGTAPAVATATIEVPCFAGAFMDLCAKDEQHTKWANTGLMVVGTKYQTTAPLVLDGGDTDNDGDVDINDVTLFLAQFGNPASAGGCMWDGSTRDADFNNNTVVGTTDYNFFAPVWLTSSGCVCSLLGTGGFGSGSLLSSIRVNDARTRAADLSGDGIVDYRDVEVFEVRYGLSGELSARMRAAK